ncbi:hypothetical protein C6382_02940 [Pseudomonas sp. BBP2017]|nr:hypothetical protein C6382_02940 [Pseudomonas sp. BBP2017]
MVDGVIELGEALMGNRPAGPLQLRRNQDSGALHMAWQPLPIILISGAQTHKGWDSPELFAVAFDKSFDIPRLIAKVNQSLRPPTSS